HAKPVYEYFDGWSENISDAKSLADLPENARTAEQQGRQPRVYQHRRRTGDAEPVRQNAVRAAPYETTIGKARRDEELQDGERRQ
ncbi:MAG: hypothetical protein ACFNL5_04070, partial [Rothia dentocariosa]